MTSISTLGQALDQMERLKSMQGQMYTLQTQLTTGKKTTAFKGLGSDVITSQRARANFSQIDKYMSNITTASRRMDIMSNAMGEMRAQAGNIVSGIAGQPQEGDVELERISDLADKVFDFVSNLMNQKDGDRYLFSGAETTSPPIADNGTMDTYIQSKLKDWTSGDITTDQLIQGYRDRTQLTDTIAGYSPQLSSGNVKGVTVRVDENTELNYTVLANNDAMRDIITAVSMIKGLGATIDKVSLDAEDPTGTVTAPGADKHEQNDNFHKVYNDLAKMLTSALDKLDTDIGKLSQTQAQIKTISTNYATEKSTLAGTISDVEDADPTEVAMKLTTLQTQLEASYRVTAAVGSLTLADYL